MLLWNYNSCEWGKKWDGQNGRNYNRHINGRYSVTCVWQQWLLEWWNNSTYRKLWTLIQSWIAGSTEIDVRHQHRVRALPSHCTARVGTLSLSEVQGADKDTTMLQDNVSFTLRKKVHSFKVTLSNSLTACPLLAVFFFCDGFCAFAHPARLENIELFGFVLCHVNLWT